MFCESKIMFDVLMGGCYLLNQTDPPTVEQQNVEIRKPLGSRASFTCSTAEGRVRYPVINDLYKVANILTFSTELLKPGVSF